MSAFLLPIFLDIAVKGLAILLLTTLATMAMRRASASARHLVWFLASISLLILPLLSTALPGWYILPRWAMNDVASPSPQPSPAPIIIPQIPAASDAHLLPNYTPPLPKIDLPPITPPMLSPMPPALPAAAPSPVHLSWQAWVLLIWLTGSALLLANIAVGFLSLWLLRRRSALIPEGDLPRLLRQLCDQLRFHRPVDLLRSAHRTMPMTWGLWRTRILLPEDSTTWSDEQRRAVLLHELAHAKRWDCLTQLLTQIAAALHWFNPLIWLAWRKMQTEREQACDDLVLSTGAKASAYAEQLLHIASEMRTTRYSAAAIAMARPSTLEGRLLAILDAKRNRRKLTWTAGAVAVLMMSALAVPLAMVRAGPIVDDINRPFVDDPNVIGKWTSVDFVDQIDDFTPKHRSWSGDLYLKELILQPDGKTPQPWLTWTRGFIMHTGDKTAAEYAIKQIDGKTYLFFQWKSGDYTLRHQKPEWYVLVKDEQPTTAPDPRAMVKPVAQPATIPPTQAKGATLDFRIAAEVGDETGKPTGNILSRELAKQYITDLATNGPQGGPARIKGFDWFELGDTDTVPPFAIIGTRAGKKYVLLMSIEPYAMLAERQGPRTWGIQRAYVTKDNNSQTAIGFGFDAPGAQKFGQLTEANLHHLLGILIDEKVVVLATIQSKITASCVITRSNGFDPAEAQKIADSLTEGMPPAAQPTTQPAAAANARTVTYRISWPDHPEALVRTMMVKDGRTRMESPDGTVLIDNAIEGKGMDLDPAHKTAAISTLENVRPDDPMFTVANIEKMADPKQYPVVSLGKKLIAGREADGVRFTENAGAVTRTVWRDAISDRPIQIETDIDHLPTTGKPFHMIYSDIVFDVPLDDSLFAIQPPQGYQVKQGTQVKFSSIEFPTTAPAKQPTRGGAVGLPAGAEINVPAAPAANARIFPERAAAQVIVDLHDQHLLFISDAELATLHDQLQKLLTAAPEPDPTLADAILKSLHQYIPAYFPTNDPEQVYLNFRDRIATLQWKLWLALTRPPLSSDEMQRRAAQVQWMHDYINTVPESVLALRASMKNPGGLRAAALADLDAHMSDPLDPAAELFPDEQFQTLQRQLQPGGEFTKLIHEPDSVLFPIEIAAQHSLMSAQADINAEQCQYTVKRFPFDQEKVIDADLNNLHLNLYLLSNRLFHGWQTALYYHTQDYSSSIADVASYRYMNYPADPAARERWFTEKHFGDVIISPTGNMLLAVRGAKIAPLNIADWFAADRLTDDDLLAVTKNHGGDSASIFDIPEQMEWRHANGLKPIPPHFYVLQTVESRLAVLRVLDRMTTSAPWCEVYIRTRPVARQTRGGAVGLPAGAKLKGP